MAWPECISVVIPVKNGAETLEAVLDRLHAQKCPSDVEIVVVDSGSTDGSLDIVARHRVLLLRIEPHEFNHGSTRNLGIASTRGELVVLLTQDAVPVDDGLFAALVAPFADARVAGVYGRQIPRDDCDVVRRRQLDGWLTGRLVPARSALDGLSLDSLTPFERYERCVFDNVCSSIRRSVWEALPFPRIPFGEDVAWARSALEAGHVIAYEPSAAVVHSHRRPIAEEYRRERLSHRVLHELFGLATVPRGRDVLRGAMHQLKTDLPYTWRHAPSGRERVRQLVRRACLAFAEPLGQHLGLRDAQRARI